MHDKFMIFDNSSIITGSMNFAKTGFSGFNSNCVFFINSKEIANIYEKEFNQMLNGKFHNSKSQISHNTIVLGKTKLHRYFLLKIKL